MATTTFIKNTPRSITIKSDDGRFVISAWLEAIMDWYTADTASRSYRGSTWQVKITDNGKSTNGIRIQRQIGERSLQDFNVNFGRYGGGLCQDGVKLSKNLVLYAAHITGMFTKALADINTDKMTRQFFKEYIAARNAIASE